MTFALPASHHHHHNSQALLSNKEQRYSYFSPPLLTLSLSLSPTTTPATFLHDLMLHTIVTIIHQSSNIPHPTQWLWLGIKRHVHTLTSQLYRHSILTNDCGNFTFPKDPCPCTSDGLIVYPSVIVAVCHDLPLLPVTSTRTMLRPLHGVRHDFTPCFVASSPLLLLCY